MWLLFVGILCLLLLGIPYSIYLGLSLLFAPSTSPAQKGSAVETVSIVLPTYNEEAIIEQTLSNLVNLSYPNDALEIIVTDSSTDRTPALVEKFAAEHPSVPIRILHEDERSGVATAVNRAVVAADGEIIFRTDCDSTVGSDAIRHAVANLQDDRFGAVTGRQAEVLGGSQVETDYRSLQARNQALESRLDSTFIIHGPCFAFRREFFRPIAADSLADDTEIAVNIRRQGKRIAFDPEMEFAEVGVSGLRGRRQRKDRRAMGLLQLLSRHRDMLGRYGLYGRVVLPFNWWFLVVAPWLTVIAAVCYLTGIGLLVPPLAVVLLGLFGGFMLLGQYDRLGPLQPLYAVFDSNISLVIASMRLFRGAGDGTWEVDAASRDVFKGTSRNE